MPLIYEFVYRVKHTNSDLWALPEDWSTHSLADNLEKNFFLRVPPENRPQHLREELALVEAAIRPPAQAQADGKSSEKEKGSQNVASVEATIVTNVPSQRLSIRRKALKTWIPRSLLQLGLILPSLRRLMMAPCSSLYTLFSFAPSGSLGS